MLDEAVPRIAAPSPGSVRWLAVSRALMRFLPAVLLFPLILLLQIWAGAELAIFPLYVFPVAQLSWEFGRRGAIAGVVLATGFWIWGSALSGQHFSQEWMRVYNGLVRGTVYAFFAALLLLFRRTLETHRRRLEAMRALIHICHGCGAVRSSDGKWVPLRELAHAATCDVHECPDCSTAVARHVDT